LLESFFISRDGFHFIYCVGTALGLAVLLIGVLGRPLGLNVTDGRGTEGSWLNKLHKIILVLAKQRRLSEKNGLK